MNAALVTTLLRQRLSSPFRLLLILLAFLPGVGLAALTRTLAPLADSGAWFAFILAAGAIGQDVSSGVLQLTFARPVSRPSYVFSRWFAAGAFGAALAVAQLAFAAALVLARDGRPDPADVALLALGNVLIAFTSAAVIVLFSSLVNGLGDVAVWFLSFVMLTFVTQLATFKQWTVVQRVCEELLRVLRPQVHLAFLIGRGEPGGYELLATISTMVLALALAVYAVNRKELSYAAG